MQEILPVVLGMLIGLFSGYFGGWPDGVLMRITDYFLVIPDVPLMIIVAAIWGPSLFHIVIVIGVAFAVTLVLVQVGLFMGLLGKATVTIENASADIWVTSEHTQYVDMNRGMSEQEIWRLRSVPGVAWGRASGAATVCSTSRPAFE